ncbi:MAG: hypothetical protein K2X38_12305 [Gemmataceae bacterium]|nr:hypothetical protein [Gemmataceae bacterium]
MALNRNSGPTSTRVFLRVFAAGSVVLALCGLALWIMGLDLGKWLAILGACAFAILLIADLPVLGEYLSQRRGTAGAGGMLQILLALILLIGLNVFAFNHYRRFDWTWDKAFTLSPEITAQLANLRSDNSSSSDAVTDIVVLQRGVYFGLRGENKPDTYDAAAGKKIVEKVNDLAEIFQDLGPRFRVQVLDYKDRKFKKRMKDLRESNKDLYDAMQNAPEDSIFFHAGGKIQRLAFHDVYQIDKQASEEQNNLVLNFQGVGPFARRILNIEEKKPRLAAAVVHPVLTLANPEHPMLTMHGAKKVLDSYGYDTRDILLRKMEDGDLSEDPAALTYDEQRFEQIEEELPLIEAGIKENEARHKELTAGQKRWKKENMAELQKMYIYVMLPNGQQGVIPRTELEKLESRKIQFKSIPVDDEDIAIKTRFYERELEVGQALLEQDRKTRDTLLKERANLNVDELAEKRRISDVEAKMKRMTADVDLLIVPRFTFLNIPRRQIIDNRVHKLDETQLRAIKAFMKQGKPVLFMLGPVNQQGEPGERPDGESDPLEKMLAELGVYLPKQTILYNAETKEFNERKVGVLFSDREVEPPPVLLQWEPGTGQVVKSKKDFEKNPIRESLWVTSRASGKDRSMELRIRHPRPVYALLNTPEKDGVKIIDESAVFLMSSPESWNEDHPFISKKGVPRYSPPAEGDPKRGGLEEERRGPFPIAIAMERSVEAWFPGEKNLPKARFAVIGHGGVFVGPTLPPMNEKLLLDTTNWLLGRDDLLAHVDPQPWSYPRADLSPAGAIAWKGFGAVILPAFFLFLGATVLMLRYVR